ncbi:MAG: alkyl hydroperoxide reductase [Candidatus Hydrogenedentes bacterium]|nr:alkyl hydroperoxide reductase [Candidatus Hydrogenedentota bacterium]
MRRRVFVALLCWALVLSAGALAPGDAVGGMTFKDIRFLPRTLDDFGERAAFVFAFTATADPGRAALDTHLKSLHESWSDKGVEIAAVHPSPADTIPTIALHGIERELPFTLLGDPDGSAARALGVEKLGSFVILDGRDKRLRYRGDGAGVAAALDAVLAGERVPETERPVDGGAIPARAVPDPDAPVTYSEHIAPILNEHCVACHRPGQTAPFALQDYRHASARADMILEVVLEERMPPWYGARKHGPFVNERTVTEAEKTLLAQWIRGDKPEGDPALAPAPSVFPDSEWAIGEPDLVLTAKDVEQIPAEGFIPYRYVTLPYQFAADIWVQGLEILPGNSEVVHHANLIYTLPGQPYDEQNGFLTGKVPGGNPVDLAPGVGMMIPKGAVLTIQIHYVTTGKPETDQMRVGIRYADGIVAKRTFHQRIRPETIAIPPGEPFYRMSAEETIPHNATVIALFTHMHTRGRDMTFFADYPDGHSETLLTIPNYSFDWQLAYQYAPGTKRFPKGTKIRTVSHYDNSAFNPYNPDPTIEVPYGDQTIHEMNDGYVFYLDEEENLNLNIDGATGQVRESVAGK